jgi:hypothetical protein
MAYRHSRDLPTAHCVVKPVGRPGNSRDRKARRAYSWLLVYFVMSFSRSLM